MGEVDFFRLGLQEVDAAAGVVIALLEGLEGGCGLAFEAEGGGDFVPVEFEGGGALEGGERGVLLVGGYRSQLEGSEEMGKGETYSCCHLCRLNGVGKTIGDYWDGLLERQSEVEMSSALAR